VAYSIQGLEIKDIAYGRHEPHSGSIQDEIDEVLKIFH
jgi:hypothetical protein